MQEQAFIRFYQLTKQALTSFLLSLGVDEMTSDDLLQEAYLKMLTHPPQKDSFQSQKSYLYTCAYRLFLNIKRKPTFGIISEAIQQSSKEDKQMENEDELIHLLKPLSEKERTILWLVYAEGYSHEEVSKILNLAPKSIKVLIFRAKAKMKKLLTPNLNHG